MLPADCRDCIESVYICLSVFLYAHCLPASKSFSKLKNDGKVTKGTDGTDLGSDIKGQCQKPEYKP